MYTSAETLNKILLGFGGREYPVVSLYVSNYLKFPGLHNSSPAPQCQADKRQCLKGHKWNFDFFTSPCFNKE